MSWPFIDHEYEPSDHDHDYKSHEEPVVEEKKPKTPAQIAEEHGVSLVLQRDKQQKWLVKPVHVRKTPPPAPRWRLLCVCVYAISLLMCAFPLFSEGI